MSTTVDISEAAFTAEVIELAQMLGWKCAHFRPLRTSHGWETPVQGDGKGFPDLLMLRPGRIVFAELKQRPPAKHRRPGVSCQCCPTPDQQAWLDAAFAAGAETYVWRPPDLQAIADILRRTR